MKKVFTIWVDVCKCCYRGSFLLFVADVVTVEIHHSCSVIDVDREQLPFGIPDEQLPLSEIEAYFGQLI